MGQSNVEETFVVISGGGPTGASLSAFLGRMGVPNVILEREEGITTDPRGIALDEDGIRILQAMGMYERVFTQIGHSQKFHFISGYEKDLMKTPLFTADYTTSEGGTGHPGFIFHKQPALERAIRDAIDMYPASELRTKSTITGVKDEGGHVEVEYKDAKGSTHTIRAKYLVGADGKTGYVRKKFLEPKGILMERSEGANYEETWVALNWHIHLPSPETHPRFPLWKLGYSPGQVYDLFFPNQFRFLCNPTRPSVCGRFGLPEDRLWRYEFVVGKDEDPDEMATKEEVGKIVYPYITHPGRRYGLTGDIQFPSDCIETLRCRPFWFSARSCNRWSDNRVILAGDAAHVFPPFGGQGIVSGFRDSIALAWRLTHLHREPAADHNRVLAAWYAERKQQLERSLAATIQNGAYVTEGDFIKSQIRDWSMWAMQLVPSWRRQIEKGARAEGMAKYTWSSGMPFIPELKGGINLPQVYCAELQSGTVGFTDDKIFAPGKQYLLQLLILGDSCETAMSALEESQGVGELSQGWINEGETTVLVHDLKAQPVDGARQRAIVRVASAEEFAADSVLCKNRPKPAYYDPYRIRAELGKDARFIIVRADRFIYAACSSREQLDGALRRLPEDLAVFRAAAKL